MKDQLLDIPRDQSELLTTGEAGKDEARPVNRLLKIHEAAQLELQDLEADFQFRLQESILQTEVKLKQRFADEQEQKIKQTEENVRKATTSELLARFEVDFQKFESAAGKWEIERQQLHHEITKLGELEMKLSEVSHEKARLQEELRVAGSHWNTERNSLKQTIQRTSDEFDAERKEFHQQIAKLEEQLASSKEIAQQVIRTPLSRELEAKLEEVRGEKTRLEEELREANAHRNAEGQGLETTQAARADTRDVSDVVKAEIARIESCGQEITQKIEDPSTDLATQIRLDRKRRELEAYIKGLRYSIGEIEFENQD